MVKTMKRKITSSEDQYSYDEMINWIESASNKELVEEFYWVTVRLSSTVSDIADKIQADQEFKLVKKELLKRLG